VICRPGPLVVRLFPAVFVPAVGAVAVGVTAVVVAVWAASILRVVLDIPDDVVKGVTYVTDGADGNDADYVLPVPRRG
jgi:hypothetical protein